MDGKYILLLLGIYQVIATKESKVYGVIIPKDGYYQSIIVDFKSGNFIPIANDYAGIQNFTVGASCFDQELKNMYYATTEYIFSVNVVTKQINPKIPVGRATQVIGLHWDNTTSRVLAVVIVAENTQLVSYPTEGGSPVILATNIPTLFPASTTFDPVSRTFYIANSFLEPQNHYFTISQFSLTDPKNVTTYNYTCGNFLQYLVYDYINKALIAVIYDGAFVLASATLNNGECNIIVKLDQYMSFASAAYNPYTATLYFNAQNEWIVVQKVNSTKYEKSVRFNSNDILYWMEVEY